jgi:hypothetical protein
MGGYWVFGVDTIAAFFSSHSPLILRYGPVSFSCIRVCGKSRKSRDYGYLRGGGERHVV